MGSNHSFLLVLISIYRCIIPQFRTEKKLSKSMFLKRFWDVFLGEISENRIGISAQKVPIKTFQNANK